VGDSLEIGVKLGDLAADRESVRSKVRLRVLIPLLAAIAVAAAGLAVVQLGLLDKVGLGSADESEAAAAVSPSADDASATTPSPAAAATTAPAEPELEAVAEPEPNTSAGMNALAAELEKHSVVVLVAYTPDSSVDAEVAREARLAADDVKAGFVSVNAAVEKQIHDLATEYDVRNTPTVLIFTSGQQLANRLEGYIDRTTVAQAAVEARALAG
jgi:hypothetical protein